MSYICAYMLTFTVKCCCFQDLLQKCPVPLDQFSTFCALACTTDWYSSHERYLWCIFFTLVHFGVHFSVCYGAFTVDCVVPTI